MDMVVTSDKLLVGGDFNGHVGSDIGGFGEVHRGFGIAKINDGAIRLLDCSVGKELCLMNACFQKRESWFITFRSGETTNLKKLTTNVMIMKIGVV